MKIYLDLLFILNFIYDYILLLVVSIVLKRNTKIKRLTLGAFLGGLSTFLLLININKYILFILKIICGIIMILFTYTYKNIKYFIENLIYLYMVSVILAGFLYFLKINFNNISYIILIIISPIILYIYIKSEKVLKEKINYYKNVEIIFNNNKKLILNGFIDSGNKLKDPVTGKYIVLINNSKIKGIYNIRNPVYVFIHTVNGKSMIPCIKIKLIIDNKEYNNYLLGVIDYELKSDIDILLNYHLLEG